MILEGLGRVAILDRGSGQLFEGTLALRPNVGRSQDADIQEQKILAILRSRQVAKPKFGECK